MGAREEVVKVVVKVVVLRGGWRWEKRKRWP